MQTHDDRDVLDMKQFDHARLKVRADETVRNRHSQITAGAPGEKILAEWDREGVHVVKRPNDEQGILRMSVGGGAADFNYCVFRGKRLACAELLERSAKALREGSTPEGESS